MTRENFRNVLILKGFEPFIHPDTTRRILEENSDKVATKLRERGHSVGVKTLSDGEHLFVVNGLNHGDRDAAFVIGAEDLETYTWRRVK